MIIAAAVVVSHVLGLLSSIHAIMTTRTEQGAIAWAVSLNTFPYVAMPAYWVLGRSRFQGYVGARQREMAEVAAVEKTATESARQFVLPTEQISPTGRAAVGLAKLPFLRGNSAATVGTAIFDNRSFRLNFEITAVIADQGLASQFERMLEADFSTSRLMEPGESDTKPWWFRFAVKLARLTAPVQ